MLNNNDVKVKSLYKAVKLLDYFDNEHFERGISELAEISGLLKSSVHNIMTTFEKCGIVEKTLNNSKYRLGLKLVALGNHNQQCYNLLSMIKPFMKQIAVTTGETVYLAMPYGNQIIYAERYSPLENILGNSIRGTVAPMYCTGVGKAMLSYLHEEKWDEVIDAGLQKFTDSTIVEPNEFREELILTRNRGYSIDNMEHEYGVKCVAVPILNIGGELSAGLSISGPSLRFNNDKIQEYAMLLQKCAEKIKEILL